MKTRYGHVSNSSTSSFIIVGKEAIEASHLSKDSYIELTKKQIRQVMKEVDEFKWNKKDQVFLTQFFSDCGPVYDRMFGTEVHCGGWEIDTEPTTYLEIYEYNDGSWNGPYSEDCYVNLNGLPKMEGIWIRKKGMI